MAATRKQKRSAKAIYQTRVKRSPCRGKKVSECLQKYGCKATKGSSKRKAFCRKSVNRNA